MDLREQIFNIINESLYGADDEITHVVKAILSIVVDERKEKCPDCDGRGWDSVTVDIKAGADDIICDVCHGTGTITHRVTLLDIIEEWRKHD